MGSSAGRHPGPLRSHPPAGRTGIEGKKVNDRDDFEEADAAADASLKYARSLPPGAARSEAFKEAGKLRNAADRLKPPSFAPRGRRPK